MWRDHAAARPGLHNAGHTYPLLTVRDSALRNILAAMRGYCDRARYLADPDFVKIPEKLTTKEYARELAKGIDLHHATPSEDLAGDIAVKGEGEHGSHRGQYQHAHRTNRGFGPHISLRH